MTLHEVLEIGCLGALIAVVIRWLFQLDVSLIWAVSIGAVSLLVQPWINPGFAQLTSPPGATEMAIGAGLSLAFLGVVQLIRGT
jgi:hypothetical protein